MADNDNLLKDNWSEDQQHGPLAWFARNRVAANLLMIFLLVGGGLTLISIQMELFPEFSIDQISIRVPYLGASPEESEEGVCMRVEEAIAAVEDIKELRSVASEGMGTVVAELEEYADGREVLDDIKSEVDQIITFPEETEKPIITEMTNRRHMLTVVLYGDVSEHTLKYLAEEVRDELTAVKYISQVEISGVRNFEISIEVSEGTLRRYGISFDQVSRAVSSSSLDLPGGSVKTSGGEILVRTKGQKYRGKEFEKIVVLTRPDGTEVYLDEIADIIDGFEDSDQLARFDGKPAVLINVFRIGEQDALEVADTVKDYVKEKKNELPAGVSIAVWSDFSRILRSRISLLTHNAYYGLTLVFLCLTLFLDLRLAFWTMMGIPISFLGAFVILPQLGVTINMISLFAFIVVLGIVVDDAIVVGENIFDYRQQGMPPLRAAIVGVKELWSPVTIAILTTVAAFLPLLYVKGNMGKIMRVIPMVVISVLMISLVEALLILPAHLSHGRLHKKPGPIARLQEKIRQRLEWFINIPFAHVVKLCVKWRYVTVAGGMVVLLATVGYVVGGHIKFLFLPDVEADNIVAMLTMPQGTPREKTEEIVRYLEDKAQEIRRDIDDRIADGYPSIYKHISTTIGSSYTGRGGPRGSAVAASGSHLAVVNIELLPSEERDIPAHEFGLDLSATSMMNRWRDSVGEIAGVSSLKFISSMFSAGDAIDVELSHRNFDTLLKAADRLKEKLAEYEGVKEISDSFLPGKMELKLSLKENGRTLGLTLADLARQVRQGFYGDEVQRVQRGRDDIRIMVRYPEQQRKSIADIENMRIRTVGGVEVPFNTVASVKYGRGYATINRTDRRRVVQVTADVDDKVANAKEINNELFSNVLPQLSQEFPGLFFGARGEEEERAESLGSLKKNFIVALLGIFGLLAVQFRSYIQPVIIMTAIPFGIVGAVIGHIIMGFNLSLLSMFGIVALTGVVVNDSLILIDLINRRRSSDEPIEQVVCSSATRRFRPIIMTTLTTFFGLCPMIFEKSLQARFLIPMAVSLAFGVLFATLITLVLIPCLYTILEDVKSVIRES